MLSYKVPLRIMCAFLTHAVALGIELLIHSVMLCPQKYTVQFVLQRHVLKASVFVWKQPIFGNKCCFFKIA